MHKLLHENFDVSLLKIQGPTLIVYKISKRDGTLVVIWTDTKEDQLKLTFNMNFILIPFKKI